MSYYQEQIRETAARLGYVGTSPRYVEAWMRVEHSTLDWMDRERFDQEVEIAIACVRNQPEKNSESLARSYGL